MSAMTRTVGYPPHAVAEFAEWDNPHGVHFTNWRAACGARGTQAGREPFETAGSARRLELCRGCFPAGHATHHPDPVKRESLS